MNNDICYLSICFFRLSENTPTIFSFSEFLAGLALMVLAWTISDTRYRFRVSTTPLPLQGITFGVVSAVGVLILLTDVWRAEQWYVPRGTVFSTVTWQGFLAGLILITFLTWAWFAFMQRSKFGKRNSNRYANRLYRVVLNGNESEQAVIADELTYSVSNIIEFASEVDRFHMHDDEKDKPMPVVTGYANDILLLIADKRFCRTIVNSSPVTALSIFNSINDSGKYHVQVGTFGCNLITEALNNKDSFIFHESEGYYTGFMGYVKPLSQAIFSNYRMVEAAEKFLDVSYKVRAQWDSEQWEAYCRLVLMVLKDYVQTDFWNHSYVLYRAIGNIKDSVSDTYKMNGLASGEYDAELSFKLHNAVGFLVDAVKVLDKYGPNNNITLRHKEHSARGTIYDHLSEMAFEMIFEASQVREPTWTAWTIQHNTVWGDIFGMGRMDSTAGNVIQHKLRRLLYNEIINMKKFPNFKGAKILALCLNVMGIKESDASIHAKRKPLHKAILRWVRKNYVWLHSYNSRVAEHCLIDNLEYDSENNRLVKTIPEEGLRRKTEYIYFQLESNDSDNEDIL